jgi:polysaccharide deacetylase family protein (PEP-CTERM system associated)
VNTVVNILQIDVEDWYCDLDPVEWRKHEPRVETATKKVLSILRETENQATFFVLGHVAEKFPGLIAKIDSEGHEVASHGYSHRRVSDQTPGEFEEDVKKSIAILEGITGKKVKGYRAPQFTVMKETLWALDILKKQKMEYDSSIFPVKTPLYGIPDAPLFPYVINSQENGYGHGLTEVPLSVYKLPILGKNIPVAGGFYFRFFPYFFLSYALRKLNRKGNIAVCYMHPWELDPGKPRVEGLKWYHYYRLSAMEEKFRKLTRDFRFISTREWIKNERG